MTFVPVESVPERGRVDAETMAKRKPLKQYFEEFMNMNVKYARVDLKFDEYADDRIASETFRHHVKKYALPIDVLFRDCVIYLQRRDI